MVLPFRGSIGQGCGWAACALPQTGIMPRPLMLGFLAHLVFHFPWPLLHQPSTNTALGYLMNRSPASRFFRKPHEILASSSIPSSSTTPFSHSRARNRSSGGSSVSSHQGQPNLLLESSSDEDGPSSARSQGSQSKSQSRSVSPPWNELSPHSIPLLPVHRGAPVQGTGGGSLMSRTPSPLPRNGGDLDRLRGGGGGAGYHEWRIGKGGEPESRGLAKWTQNGRLGWWLWNTQRGWMMYIGLLVVFYGGAGFALSKVNEFTLLSK